MYRSNFFKVQDSLIKMTGNRAEIPQKDALTIATSHIYVVRNEAFEPYLAHAINCAAQIGVDLTLEYSEYNDSISFTELPERKDFIVLWFNWERIPTASLEQFFNEDSLLATWAQDSKVFFVLPSSHGLHDIDFFKSELESIKWPHHRLIEGLDLQKNQNRRFKLGYTREELDSIVTKIGLQVTSNDPQLRIRALILDLDNTLYHGVYGEDSEDEVYLESSHIKLHAKLKQLRDAGVLLCIASKNNIADIETILSLKLTSGLKKEDFAIIQGGWESKTISVQKILEELNFSEQFVAFVDDNRRELYEVGSSYPNLICIDGQKPESVLFTFSTLLSFEKGVSSEIIEQRTNDIKNSRTRFQLASNKVDKDSLLVELETTIKSRQVANSEDLDRAMELFRKTNQFNLTLNRTTLEDRPLIDFQNEVILATLADKISDSGTIGAMYFSFDGDVIEIKEFAISCRALGRDAEKYILRSMLTRLEVQLESRIIFVRTIEGPKNQPAMEFVRRFFREIDGGYVLNTQKLRSETMKWYGDICEI
jgi:FkbH-like protein